MKFESTPTTERVLDEKWFHELEKNQVSPFSLLDGDQEHRERERDQFLNRQIENPSLDYPFVNIEELDCKERNLLDLKERILEEESNETLKKVYRTKINEAIAEIRMLKATSRQDDKRFLRYSQFLYGLPEPENTAYVFRSIKEKIEKTIPVLDFPEPELIDESRIRLRKILDTFQADNLKVIEDLEQPAPDIDPEGANQKLESIEEVKALFIKALEDIGASDWSVVVDNSKGITNIRTLQSDKTVELPTWEKLSPAFKQYRRIKAVIAHEVGTHVQRHESGSRTSLKILGLGLDRNEKGEEGVATFNEQQISGTKDFASPDRYFAIALATGQFDGIKRDFRQTFEVMKDYFIATLKPDQKLIQKSENSAWKLCVRIFRGTSSKMAGAVFTKDMLYFQGNRETWHLVDNDPESNVVKTFRIGKFDAANQRHVGWILELLYGIEDSDLKRLSEML